jgi:hypothetical protein
MKSAVPSGRPLPSPLTEGSIVRIGFKQRRESVHPVQSSRKNKCAGHGRKVTETVHKGNVYMSPYFRFPIGGGWIALRRPDR